MKTHRYPNYTDSGFDWMGEIPNNWKIKRVGHHVDFTTGFAFKSEQFSFESGTKLVRGDNVTEGKLRWGEKTRYWPKITEDIERYLLKANDVLIGMDGSKVGKNYTVVIESDLPLLLVQRVARLRVDQKLNYRFLTYLIGSELFKIWTALVKTDPAIPHISPADIRAFPLPYPSSEEQQQIAAFLDHETAKIDRLIEKQQQLIELLKEKRQAVISHAVTKGLNPNAPLKPSGVEWLGDVPEHWKVRRLNLLFTESNKRASTQEELERPILSVSIHHGISDTELNDEELDRKQARSEDRSLYKTINKNDLCYNMMRAWQGGFGASNIAGLVSPAYVVCCPRTNLNSYYFELVLRTQRAVTELKRYSRGITDFRLRLYWDEFKNIQVPIPPKDETELILKEFVEINDQYEKLINVSTEQISLLQERRTALISAAVTGKIDVRNWQAK